MKIIRLSQVADPAQNVQQQNQNIVSNDAQNDAQNQFAAIQEEYDMKRTEWNNQMNDLFQYSIQAVNTNNDWQTALNYMNDMVNVTQRAFAELNTTMDLINQLSQQTQGIEQGLEGM